MEPVYTVTRTRGRILSLLHIAARCRASSLSLGYVEGNTVQLKGRVACEINTCDELIATEMVFENVLESLDPPEIAGLSRRTGRLVRLISLCMVHN